MRRGCLWAFVVVLLVAAPLRAVTVTTEAFQGITLIHRTETSPRKLDIHVALIDTLAPGISFMATPESPHANDTVIAQRTSSFMAQVGAQLAINGDFYSSAGTFNGLAHRNPTSFAASAGNIYSPFEIGRPAINIAKNNVPHMVVASTSTTAGKLQPNPAVPVWNAVGGWDYLLNNGVQPAYITDPTNWRYQFANELHPRTAIGISADRRHIAMFVVDGRQTDSGGINFPEMADMLKNDYGMHWAINLDGGGSTTMAISDPMPRVLNDPSDAAGERLVANSLAVFARPTPPPVPSFAIARDFSQQAGVYTHGASEVNSHSPSQNSGATSAIRIGYDTALGKSRGVLSFDLSAIGRDSTIHGVSLTLEAISTTGATGNNYIDLELYKLSSTASEDEVTWNQKSAGNNWSVGGGDIDGRSLSSLFAQKTAGAKTFVSTTDFVAAAQSALTAGTPLSLLVTALSAEAQGAALGTNLNMRFRSDDATSGVRPRLTIHYTPGPLMGDWNLDSAVNAADYVLWREGAGTVYSPAEYAAWRSSFGGPYDGGSGASAAEVPEPGVLLLILAGVSAIILRGRARGRRNEDPPAVSSGAFYE